LLRSATRDAARTAFRARSAPRSGQIGPSEVNALPHGNLPVRSAPIAHRAAG
jgi:hypothetical protein